MMCSRKGIRPMNIIRSRAVLLRGWTGWEPLCELMLCNQIANNSIQGFDRVLVTGVYLCLVKANLARGNN